MPGRHGGAVPARPARGYLGKSSPCTTGSTASGASTGEAHTPMTPQATIASTRKRSGGVSSSEATGADETRARSSQRSHRRGEGFRIHLVEEEEGSEAIIWPKWRQRRSPEPAEIARRRRRQLGFDRVSLGEWEGGSANCLGRFDRPSRAARVLASLGGLGWN
jgi:hypothetical protein